MTTNVRTVLSVLLFSVLAHFPLKAVINVGLQPADLFERYETVLTGEIERVDEEAGGFFLRVTALHKGETPEVGEIIEISAVDAMAEALADQVDPIVDIAPGKPVAAFVGMRQRRAEDQLLFYAGGFYLGTRVSDSRWNWTDGDTQMTGVDGQPVPTMAGTWNGSTPQLNHMLEDLARGEAYFPRRGYAAFKEDILIDQLDDTVRGIALYDLYGNGLPDIYVSSPDGDRVYLQMAPLEFIDATEWLGLEQASVSIDVADFDLDGIPDLLVGGTLLRGSANRSGQHGFTPVESFPHDDEERAALKAAAFIEADGDGYPDVIVSLEGGGLRLYRNPGESGGAFTDITEHAGLDRTEAGAGGNGYFTLGDWTGDGRTDIHYAAGPGFLLIQDSEGRFAPHPDMPELRFTSGPDDAPGLTGAGAFAPIIGSGRFDLIIPVASSWHVIENRNGQPIDVTEYGNEINEGSFLHLSTVASDLTLDGNVDIYTISRAQYGHNRFIINRGYGSFMLATVHRAYDKMFSGPSQELGGWALATGDANGDGQPDILLGNEHGHVVLILNDTLSYREPVEHPTDDVARMLQAGVLAVTVEGPRGVVGAIVQLETPEGATVDMRFIGGNNAAGSRGPDEAIFGVRKPGDYLVRVRYADGHERTWPVEISPATQAIARLTATRSD